MVLKADNETVTTERIGIIVYLLARGRVMSTVEAADIAGVSRDGALKMLSKLSRCLPLYLSDDGKWRFIDLER